MKFLRYLSLEQKFQQVEELNADLVKYPISKIFRNSYWIKNASIDPKIYSVVLFRKEFNLTTVPDSLIIHITADNIYHLFINSQYVCFGPSRDDLAHWRYETIDIAKFLKKGKNIIAVQVNNFGHNKGVYQFSDVTALLITSHYQKDSVVCTEDKTWKTYVNKAFKEKPVLWMYQIDIATGWYCQNPTDTIDGTKYPWGWQGEEFDDSKWPLASWSSSVFLRYGGVTGSRLLIPRSIRLLRQSIQRYAGIARTENIDMKGMTFNGKDKLVIAKNSKVSILLDNKVLTTGFPELIVSKGKGSSIRAIYSESLFIDKINKGNRNEIKGKHIIGISDVFLPDGGMKRNYQALWYRPCRFIQLDIVTKDEPLVIDDFYNLYTTYPLEEKGHFYCDNPLYAKIWDAGWRTDLLCAQDELEADAYYEAMQYAHDSKIYGLSYSIVSGDYALYKQCIQQFNQSRIPDGLSLGAYPSDWHTIWPFFSLDWVDMVHDYLMLTGDFSLAKEVMPGVRCVLDWYNRHLNERGLLGKLEWANPHGTKENSSLFTLQYAFTLENTATVCHYLGLKEEEAYDRKLASKLSETVYRLCWDEKRQLIAKSPEKNDFQNWDNALAVILDAIPQAKQKEVMLNIINNTSIKMQGHCEEALTGYPQYFFIYQAMKKAGISDRFTQTLKPWKYQIEDLGLTTFKQDPMEPIRSDCLPWSTTPLYSFFNLVCGIEPIVPGYHQLKIEPNFGDLKMINAAFPLPDGMISMVLKRNAEKVEGTIQLPKNMKGVFVWKNQQKQLIEGTQKIDMQ